MKRVWHSLIVVVLTVIVLAAADEDLEQITMGIIPTESSSAAMKGFERQSGLLVPYCRP
jgi:hypothetical protein